MRRRWVVLAASWATGCTLFVDLAGLSSGDRTTDTPDGASGVDGGDATAQGSDGGDATVVADADAGPPSTYVSAVLADKPIAYFSLEETSGTTARDRIAGLEATWVGTVTLGAKGAVGNGAVFDGASTRLEMPVGSFAFDGKATYSVELWLRADTVDDKVRRVFSNGTGDSRYTVYFADSFFLGSRSDYDGGNDGYANVTPPRAGETHHYVLTFDGTVQRLYRDGTPGEPANSNVSLPNGSGARLVFGDGVTGTFFKLQGLLDEIAIYDQALPEARIRAHFAAR
ncbi:MAG: LamG domain-containing protein [Deltaproteobacteria bacterium]|nr:LamG domain-containing protein [Deltaproteobacteria bacterium]